MVRTPKQQPYLFLHLHSLTNSSASINSSNMLYPRENRETSTLMYRCRTCNYEEVATSYCVFRNQLSTQIMETAGVTTEVGSDPTLPRAKKHCTRCDGDESVFFQSQQRTADTKMVRWVVSLGLYWANGCRNCFTCVASAVISWSSGCGKMSFCAGNVGMSSVCSS